MRDNLCISFVEFHMKLFTRAVLHGILLIVFEMWWEYQERSLAFHEYVLELVIFPMWLTNMHKMLWVHERIWIVLFNVVGWIYCIFSCSSRGDQRTCQRKWFIAVQAGLNSKKKKKTVILFVFVLPSISLLSTSPWFLWLFNLDSAIMALLPHMHYWWVTTYDRFKLFCDVKIE